MITQTVIIFLQIAVLWWLFAWLYFDYRLDLLRYKIFVLRDQLFNYAENGHIAFDSPAYQITRRTLNGALRHAHRINLSEVLITCFVQSKYNANAASQYHEMLNNASHNLTIEQQKFIAGIRRDLHLNFLSHILHTSIIFFPFVAAAKLTRIFYILMKALKHHSLTKGTRKKLEHFDALIYDLGKDHCPAI